MASFDEASAGRWVCPSCTFICDASHSSCSMCDAPRASFDEASAGRWVCPSCTFICEASHSSCSMCDAPRAKGEEEDAAAAAPSPAAAAAAAAAGEETDVVGAGAKGVKKPCEARVWAVRRIDGFNPLVLDWKVEGCYDPYDILLRFAVCPTKGHIAMSAYGKLGECRFNQLDADGEGRWENETIWTEEERFPIPAAHTNTRAEFIITATNDGFVVTCAGEELHVFRHRLNIVRFSHLHCEESEGWEALAMW